MMRSWARWLLITEVIVCFGPSLLMLLMGAVILPMQVAVLLSNSFHWEGSLAVLIAVPCGVIGLCSLCFVVSLLLGEREIIEKPVPVLGGVLAGAAPLLMQAVMVLFYYDSDNDSDASFLAFTVWLPLFATAHILYLSRHLFVAGFRYGARPIISKGSWLVGALVISATALAIWLWQGISYNALEQRRVFWLTHRPAAYTYDFRPAGYLEPRDLTFPKRVKVVGTDIAGASYTFGRRPDATTEYASPAKSAWTIDRIFETLLEAKKKGARVHVRFDGTTGWMTDASVDYEGLYSDWEVNVSNFRVLDVETARQTPPMFVSVLDKS